MSKGTVSFWVNMNSSNYIESSIFPVTIKPEGNSKSELYSISQDKSKIQLYIYSHNAGNIECILSVGGIDILKYSIGDKNIWHHIYILWDENNLKLFINGKEVKTYNGDMPDLSQLSCSFKMYGEVYSKGGQYLIWDFFGLSWFYYLPLLSCIKLFSRKFFYLSYY
jgi:hypothetical protein